VVTLRRFSLGARERKGLETGNLQDKECERNTNVVVDYSLRDVRLWKKQHPNPSHLALSMSVP